jgi:hypothetical protein
MSQNQTGKTKQYFIFLVFLFTLSSCKQNPTLESSMSDCNSSIETVQSYGDTIRLKYDIEYQEDADRIAGDWCTAREKFFERNTINCKGCCVATYICKEQK